MMKRCPECGSWEKECASDDPVKGCRCVRCATAEIARLREAIQKESKEHETILALHPYCSCQLCEIAREGKSE